MNHINFCRAINIENDTANKIKNVLNGEWGGVPDVARQYKSEYSDSLENNPYYAFTY